MATKKSDSNAAVEAESAARPSFGEVKAALDKALGKPKKSGGILRYTAPDDANEVKDWVGRVHAAGGSASLAEAHPARVLAVVEGQPSALMDLVTWISWQSKSARKALDILDKDAGLRVANINYTNFVIQLDRAPRDPDAHAKRLAKIVLNGNASKIAAALKTKRWKTG
ncbi:MAG: hypothetical protein ACKV2T_10900 [Kofleriaceae bacterium]